MSYITDVLIYTNQVSLIEEINDWLRLPENCDRGLVQLLRRIDMAEAGGGKHFVTDVWAAAFNYMPLGLPKFVRSLGWWGSAVIIFSGEDHGEVIGGNWSEFGPVDSMCG